jgi:hypothetical protein
LGYFDAPAEFSKNHFLPFSALLENYEAKHSQKMALKKKKAFF